MKSGDAVVEKPTPLREQIRANLRRLNWKFWLLAALWEFAFGLGWWGISISDEPASPSDIAWLALGTVLPAIPLRFSNAQLTKGLEWAAKALAVWGLLYAVLAGGSYVAVYFFPESAWAYAWRYKVSSDLDGAEVSVDARPHDCEFWTAPVGSKNCHYEAVVTTVRTKRADGKILASYDDGGTWIEAEASLQRAVFVAWSKVRD